MNKNEFVGAVAAKANISQAAAKEADGIRAAVIHTAMSTVNNLLFLFIIFPPHMCINSQLLLLKMTRLKVLPQSLLLIQRC